MLFLSGNLSLSLSLLLLLRISHTYLLRRRFWKRLCVSVCFADGNTRLAVGFLSPLKVNISGGSQTGPNGELSPGLALVRSEAPAPAEPERSWVLEETCGLQPVASPDAAFWLGLANECV